MSLFSYLDSSGSALTANRLRMDIVSSNIANANTTRGRLVDGQWIPYRRKMAHIAPAGQTQFASLLHAAIGRVAPGQQGGVKVTGIVEDQTPFKRVYQPDHPDAGPDGYVLLPNVDLLREMADLTMISRSYEANVNAFNVGKQMFMKALEIGR